jgi:hypothetical protein
MVPAFTADRSTREAPSCYPGSIAMTTPQTFTMASGPGAICRPRSRPPGITGGRALQPGPHPPDSSRHIAYGTSTLVPVRTPSRLACRTRTVWQYRHVPSLSGLLSTLPGVPRIRLPPASRDRCDDHAGKVSHLHSVQQRLAAHEGVDVDDRIHRADSSGRCESPCHRLASPLSHELTRGLVVQA